MQHRDRRRWLAIVMLLAVVLFARGSEASTGDRLPEFKQCVEVCERTNCAPNGPKIPLQRRLLLWTCPAECDYACQHIVTAARTQRGERIEQFHGKWPFHRFLGLQEPFSVLFSLLNYLAHAWGLRAVRAHIPPAYPLRRYYVLFGLCGLASWVFSMLFHARDFPLTEKLDYFAAGASVMYGLYYAPVRIFRLDGGGRDDGKDDGGGGAARPRHAWKGSVLRAWTALCLALYAAHVAFLTLVRWDYTYNMAANVAAGIVQNLLWSGFSVVRFRRMKRLWAAWPGLIVAWIVLAMSLELFDFAPFGLMLDAHALWHAGTVGPTIWWYNFLLRDAQDDLQGARLKQ